MNWNQALFPSLHHRKEGWLRHQKNFAQPQNQTQPGWFSFVFSLGKPPRPRDQQMLRSILLIARPPLLLLRLRAAALALRGGDARREYARFQFVHTFCDREPPLQFFYRLLGARRMYLVCCMKAFR